MRQLYKCPNCSTTKTLIKHSSMSESEFTQSLPKFLICYYQGCLSSMLPKKEDSNATDETPGESPRSFS